MLQPPGDDAASACTTVDAQCCLLHQPRKSIIKCRRSMSDRNFECHDSPDSVTECLRHSK